MTDALLKRGYSLKTLFAKNKDAFLALETDFAHLSISPEQNGVVARRRIAVFPAAFAFGNDLAVTFDGGFVSINDQAVFAGLERGFAEPGGLRDVDGFAEWFCKGWNGQNQCGQQRGCRERKERSAFHACPFPFARESSAGQPSFVRQDGLTRRTRYE